MVLVEERGLTKSLSLRNGTWKFFIRVSAVVILLCTIYYTCLLSGPTSNTTASFSFWNIKKLLSNSMIHPASDEVIPHGHRHLILLWTPFFGKENWLPSTRELFCPINNCEVTSNRQRFNESSAVLLHWRDIKPNDLPVCPNINITFPIGCPLLVLFNKEAPPHTYVDTIEKMNDKIHWTVTYRRDSDIIAPYGKIMVRNDVSQSPGKAIKLNRNGVCWLVSNCHTSSRREDFINELQKSIDVKIFGKCGNSTCPYEKTLDCYEWLSNQCRFYLALENSICKDYSTEKLYNAMMFDMVPVVFGGDDYNTFLPKHSFINIKDYSSPGTLAKFLLELDRDNSKYLAYFEWKNKYSCDVYSYEWLCELCEKLHKTKLKDVKPYADIITWWYQDACDDKVSEY